MKQEAAEASVASVTSEAVGHALNRPARPDDADHAAPLVFASGEQEFGFLFGVSPAECTRFLRAAFASTHGRFSWRRHWVSMESVVSTDEGYITVAVLAAHGSRSTLSDNLWFAWMTLRFFGLQRTVGILRRGLILETELPPPRRGETLLAHCATHANARSQGLFSALLNAAQTSSAIPSVPQTEALVLDVLVSNERAARLYRRLGFVALERKRPLARGLPAALESVRMRLSPERSTRMD
jgi:ribosomal protein S18 acetylase RimI-like enzyme